MNLGGGFFYDHYTSFTNTGTMALSNAEALYVQNGPFTNSGMFTVAPTSQTVMIDSQSSGQTFTNLSGTTLTGGAIQIGANSTLDMRVGGTVAVDAACITLTGERSALQFYNAGTVNADQPIETMLTTITAAGTLAVLGGRGWNTTNPITDSGLLQMGGNTFAAAGVTIASDGHLLGFGNFTETVANSGSIEAQDGLLRLQALSGSAGTLQIDAGATLEIGSATGEKVTFNGLGATLKLDVPGSYTGTLDPLVPSDTIELVGVTGTTAQINSGTLTVNLSGGGAEHYAVSGSFTGVRPAVILDGTGDTFVVLYRYGDPAAHTPEPVTIGNQHISGALRQALTITNTASVDGYSENLDANMSGATASVVASGTINLLAPGSTDTTGLQVGVDTGSDGVKRGTVTIDLFTDRGGLDSLGPLVLPSQTVNVSGTVYAFAEPNFSTTSVSLGAARVGDAAPTNSVTITDGTTDVFMENLSYGAGTPSSPFAVGSGGSGTIVAGGSATLDMVMNTATAGVFNAGTESVVLTSVGGGGLSNTTLTPQGLALSGKVYAPAVAQLGTSSVDFHAVHVGDSVSTALIVSNTATGALADVLTGGFGTISAGFGGSGALGAGVVAGNSGAVR